MYVWKTISDLQARKKLLAEQQQTLWNNSHTTLSTNVHTICMYGFSKTSFQRNVNNQGCDEYHLKPKYHQIKYI